MRKLIENGIRLNPSELTNNIPNDVLVRFNFSLQSSDVSLKLHTIHEAQDFPSIEVEEFYFIINGTGKFKIGNEIFSLNTGDFFFVPVDTTCQIFDIETSIQCWKIISVVDPKKSTIAG